MCFFKSFFFMIRKSIEIDTPMQVPNKSDFLSIILSWCVKVCVVGHWTMGATVAYSHQSRIGSHLVAYKNAKTPSKSFMGESCWAFCYNHFILIHNIYPSNKSSEIINNSSLSLLIFYANSKPQKLPKIGLVLENKGLNDLYRNRIA